MPRCFAVTFTPRATTFAQRVLHASALARRVAAAYGDANLSPGPQKRKNARLLVLPEVYKENSQNQKDARLKMEHNGTFCLEIG